MTTATTPRRRPAKRAASKGAPKSKLRLRTKRMKDGKEIHWYEVLGQDGKMASASGRGVTTLLGNGSPSGGLVKWAANKAADCALDEQDIWRPLVDRSRDAAYDYIRNASDRDRDEAGGRGSQVHDLAERLSKGEEVEVPELLEGHVDSYIRWVEDWAPEIVATEVVIANFSRWYFGKFDLLYRQRGWFPDDPERVALLLGDLKTARSGVREKDALQLTAYSEAEVCGLPDADGWVFGADGGDLDPMPKVDGLVVIHLSADAYTLHPVADVLRPKLFAQFLHTVRVAEFHGSGWKEEDKGWSKDVFEPGPALPYEAF